MIEHLARDEVHVWFGFVRDCLERESERELLALLPERERREYREVADESVRGERILSRALLRTALTRYLGGQPSTQELTRIRFGRPELSEPGPLRFNVAHSTRLVACAFTRERAIGVDTEDWTRAMPDPGEMAGYLAASERHHLETLSGESRRRAFFRYWTLKEAFVKAKGVGLSYGFDSFAVELSSKPPRLATPDARRWCLVERDVPPTHLVAIAAERIRGEDVRLRMVPVTRAMGLRRRDP